MFCNRRVYPHRGFLAALAFFLTTACSHQSTTAPTRVAVLRFENLTPDQSLDWMGRAASEVVAHEIGGNKATVLATTALHGSPLAQFRPVSAPGQSAESEAALSEGATRLILGQISRAGNRLLLDVTERDPATERTLQQFTVTAGADDVYRLADEAARRLTSAVVPFESRNNQAIAAWSRALEEPDAAGMNNEYARAVQADPNFSAAWLSWAAAASGRGDREAAEKILAEAGKHASGFNELGRARWKMLTAQLSGNRAAALAAIEEINRLLPDDVDNLRATADQNYAARNYPAAAAAYRRLTQLSPDVQAWNQLGYVLMSSGDYDGAMSALRTYQQMRPNEPNPLDSQGDVAFAFGRFDEAEKLYDQAAAKDPGFQDATDLYKAAEARLMSGDIAGGDKKFDTYAAARRAANDPLLAFRTAQWRFLSGRHDDAFRALAGFPARATALTQMAIWDLQLDRRARALQECAEAVKSGGATAPTIIAWFAAEDLHTPAEWSARADRVLAAPQMAPLKLLALGYALYMSHQWQAAEPVWKQLVDRAGPDDAISPVVYAHILVELNRPRDAEPFARRFPIPQSQGTQEFLTLAIPRIFAVRAAVFASEGKSSDAESSRKIFATLWGPGAPPAR